MYSRKAANRLVLIALALGIIFLQKYLGIFALAALTTVLFNPVHNWFLSKKNILAKFSTGFTIVIVLLTLLLPITALLGLSYYEGQRLVSDLKNSNIVTEKQVGSAASQTSDSARQIGLHISAESIRAEVDDLIKKIIPGLIDFIIHTTGSIATAVANAIVYFMLLATMFSRKNEIIDAFKRISPLDEGINNEYLNKVKAMAVSMAKGTFIIAVVVGFISAVALWIIDFPYIAFWFLLFTLMSLIPLGAGIIFVPIGIIMLLAGNVWQGLLILAVQFLILNNVDNVLRPKLAPKGSTLPGILILISTFAGVGYFGLLGVIYGPIIMVLIYTTVELYDRHRKTGFPLKENAGSLTN